MQQFIQKYWKYILGLVLLLALCFYMYNLGNKARDAEAKFQEATVLTSQQAIDINSLQNELQISKQNAELTAATIAKAQTGQLQPVTNFIVQAASSDQAAQQVATRINSNDNTLPPVALEKTDRTVVSSVPATAEQKISIDKQNNKDGTKINDQYITQVYKINNYRNWEWSAGYGQHGGDRYVPIELQRNFSKDAAVSVEYHAGGKEKGGEVKYTRKTDKLFGVF